MEPETTESEAGRPRHWRGVLLNLALLLVSLVVAYCIGEVVVRIFAPQQLISISPHIWEPADSLGFMARPNVNTTIDTGDRVVHMYTDSLGMRIGARGRTNSDAKTRVLVMGDSFMEALQVEYEQSFPALLERALSRGLGKPISVWDAGINGWDPPEYLVRTRQLMAHHKFALLVVAFYLGNDIVPRLTYRRPFQPARRHHFRIPRNLSWHEVVDALLYPINDFLEVHSELFIFFRTRFQGLLMRMRLSPVDVPAGILLRDSTSTMWNVTATICSDIQAVAARHGTPTLFVLIPPPFAVDPNFAVELRRGYGLDSTQVDAAQPNRLMLEALQSRGIPVVAVESEFDSAAALGAQLYGHIDRHLSPGGHRLLERLVAPLAARMLAPQAALNEKVPVPQLPAERAHTPEAPSDK